MPRYYFNICTDAFEETDVVGESCPDDVAALGKAFRAASDLVQHRLRSDGHPASGWIEVEDQYHRPVLKLPLTAAAY